jgi:hypothetical protein
MTSAIRAKLLDNYVEEEGPLPTPCWVWQGALDNNGYGICGGQHTHRISFEEFVEPIPLGKQINHHCDNRACVNPEHLYAGTQGDNVDDMVRRGRNRWASKVGDSNPKAFLSEEQVTDILELLAKSRYRHGKYTDIAEKFGVEPYIISRIALGITWQHVKGSRPGKRKRDTNFRGVYLKDGKWRASLKVNGSELYLGTFGFESDAAICWNWHVGWYGLDRPLNVITEADVYHD